MEWRLAVEGKEAIGSQVAVEKQENGPTNVTNRSFGRWEPMSSRGIGRPDRKPSKPGGHGWHAPP
jgi:hypothetical protein